MLPWRVSDWEEGNQQLVRKEDCFSFDLALVGGFVFSFFFSHGFSCYIFERRVAIWNAMSN